MCDAFVGIRQSPFNSLSGEIALGLVPLAMTVKRALFASMLVNDRVELPGLGV